MFPLSSCRSSGSEKEFSAVTTSSLGPLPSAKFSPCSPSGASNPILRLMGKNLMVVSKDEDTSTAQAPAPAPLHAQSNHQSLQFPPFPGTNADHNNSFHPFVNQGMVNFSHDPRGQMSNGFASQSRFQSGVPFQNQYSFAGYADEYRGERFRPKNRLGGGASMYNLERVEVTNPRHKNSAAVREIIMIDDGTESEAVKQVEGTREISYGHVPNHGLSYGNSFSSYHQSRDGESTTLQQGVHFQAARRSNASPVKWSCTSEGPPGMQQRTLYNGAVPPRTNHLRSPLYYSPNLP